MIAGNIKNLIIDLGGVLLDLYPTRCVENFKKLGLKEFESLITPFRQHGIFMDYEKGKIAPDDFRDELRHFTDRELTDEQLDYAWNTFLVEMPSYKLDLLLHLREHYMVYLLSNTNITHWNWACENCFNYKGFTVKDFFEKVYLSFERRCAKPGKEIFEWVLEDAGLLPEETLFIDDSPENCRTARLLGLSTYTPAPKEDWSHIFR
ncbi:MAG: HAD family phosphatase [Bacteroides sp.]|nr:HAD family phosphatase [Bacteroides sp.]